MDIAKTNKEKMPVTKKGFLIGLLLILTIGCSTTTSVQKKIKGKFYPKLNYYNGESSFYYQFSDSTFTTRTSMNLDMVDHAGGTYRIAHDTLFLDYEPLQKLKSLTYRIIGQETIQPLAGQSNDTLGSVDFSVVDRKGKPIQSANALMRNRSEKMIKGYGADSLGHFPTFSISNKAHDFYFFFVGRHPVTIPADTLAAYDSEVEVLLTGITYSQYDGIKKFLIKEAERDQIVLQPLGNDQRERVVWVRAGTDN